MGKKFVLEFYYDIISPYTLLAHHVLQRYKPIWRDLEMIYKPIFLGGAMKGSGNKPPAFVPNKAKFLTGDMARNAALFQIDILPTAKNFFEIAGKPSLGLSRMLVCVPVDYVESVTTVLGDLYHRSSDYRQDGKIVLNSDIPRIVLEKAGVPNDLITEILSSMTGAEAKQRLVENTNDAVKRGCFGSPTFFVSIDGEENFFFGSDRFEQLTHSLNLPWYGSGYGGKMQRSKL